MRQAIIFSLIISILLGTRTNAQQTIFNVPTSDVLDKGGVYLEVDASFKPNDQDGALLFREGIIVTNVPYHLKN